MEYCELGDLGRYLRQNGTLTEDEAKDVMYQVVTALAMMHVEGFAHRDLKPSVSYPFFQRFIRGVLAISDPILEYTGSVQASQRMVGQALRPRP